jgi:uncharacterized protein with ParB-like and HNH nuclease domain
VTLWCNMVNVKLNYIEGVCLMADNLILKSINQLLEENFYIPYYQRGYRWTDQQVNDLLNDIWAFANKIRTKDREFYCLQPVVIKEKSWEENGGFLNGWEVIDGQQRLTTIYIIISYLAKEFLKVERLQEDYGKEIYTIRYETRPGSENFLKNIKDDSSNIDFYYMSKAYKTVKEWFTNGQTVKDRSDRDKFLRTILGKMEDEYSVQVIWYRVNQQINSLDLFTRLNVGKISLTNSELIKALFLSSASFDNEAPEDARKMQIEISLLWDDMEQKLGDESFWAFVTNASQSVYSNKIELLFDIISGKKESETDSLFTFIYFLNESKKEGNSLWDLWLKIEQYFQTLCEWYKNKNLYHKIGYLIATGEDLKNLIDISLTTKKDEFEAKLDLLIKVSVNVDIDKLSYENNSDYKQIEKILLLFNVESIRRNRSISENYPFKFHKATKWSLEHIHAQNSEGLDKTKKEPWLLWLSFHKNLMEDIRETIDEPCKKSEFSNLIDEVNNLNKDVITWEKFNALSTRIIKQFTEQTSGPNEDIHGISNLALLSQPDNSALNNSVFEVKRREIINMDKQGDYIPICTRRVFLKYYNPSASNEHFYFWSLEDRTNYLCEIKTVLIDYLPEQVLTEE